MIKKKVIVIELLLILRKLDRRHMFNKEESEYDCLSKEEKMLVKQSRFDPCATSFRDDAIINHFNMLLLIQFPTLQPWNQDQALPF
jgi:hypothetical protein